MDRFLIGNVDEYQQYADVPHEPFIASGNMGKTYIFMPFCDQNASQKKDIAYIDVKVLFVNSPVY